MTLICASKLDKGVSPVRRHAIIWTNAGPLLTEPLGAYFSEIWIEIQQLAYKKMNVKMSSEKSYMVMASMSYIQVYNIHRGIHTTIYYMDNTEPDMFYNGHAKQHKFTGNCFGFLLLF